LSLPGFLCWPAFVCGGALTVAATSGILAALRVTRPAPAERTTEQIQVLAKVFTPEGKEVGPGAYLLTIEARAAAVTVRRDVRFSVK
jgi:hypothetical protein